MKQAVYVLIPFLALALLGQSVAAPPPIRIYQVRGDVSDVNDDVRAQFKTFVDGPDGVLVLKNKKNDELRLEKHGQRIQTYGSRIADKPRTWTVVEFRREMKLNRIQH